MHITIELRDELIKLLESLADKTQSRAEHARVQELIKQLTPQPTGVYNHETSYF
jgi:predicted transcriptional regulator